MVFSGYYLARLTLSPLAGALSDRYSPRKLLLGATFCAASLVSWYHVVPRQYTLLAIQFGLGLCSGVLKPVLFGYLARITPEKKQGRIFGWSTAAANMVFFLGPALGGLLFSCLEIDEVLLVVAGILLLAAVVLFFFPKTETLPIFDKPEEKAVSTRRQTAVSGTALLVAVFGRTLGISSLLVFFPILLTQKLACPDWLTGLLVALPGGISCLLLPFTGRLADRLDRRLFILGGMTMSAAALVMIGYCSTTGTFVAVGTIMGIGTAFSLPSSMVQATEYRAGKGRAMGIFQMAASAGFLFGPILSGLLVQLTASPALSINTAGIFGLISCFPLAVSVVRKQQGTTRFRINGLLVAILILILVSGLGALRYKQLPAVMELKQTTKKQETHRFANLAMGGIVHLKLEGTSKTTADQAANEAFSLIAALERDFGHRNASGSIGNVNRLAGKTPAEVSSAAFALLERALHFCARTKGVFDITIGAITVYPLYYQKKISQRAAALIDYRTVVLEPSRHTVFLPKPGMALDLGGLAKGSIVDAAAAVIKKAGVPSALIEASGDFYCYGNRIWKIGIQDPRSEGLLGVIEVKNAGVCGSGDYYQYIPSSGTEGGRSHHILDPHTSASAARSIGVTVIAPRTELADALATTLFIMGPERGRDFLKDFDDCAALWVLPDGTLVSSAGFPPFIE